MRNAIAPALVLLSSALGAQCIPFSSPTPGIITSWILPSWREIS